MIASRQTIGTDGTAAMSNADGYSGLKWIKDELGETIRQARPYAGGNDPLYALHEYCHRARDDYFVAAGTARMAFELDGAQTRGLTMRAPVWDSATRTFTCLHDNADHLPGKSDVRFFVALGGSTSLRSQPAITVLRSQLELVSDLAESARRDLAKPRA